MSQLWETQQRNRKGQFGLHDGIKYRQSDIDAAYRAGVREGIAKANDVDIKKLVSDAFLAGMNSSRGVMLPSRKLELWLKENNLD